VASPFERPIFARARTLCLKWPEVTEKTSWGHPNFRAGKKTFVAFEMIKGRPSIAFKMPPRRAKRLLGGNDPFATPYGRNQWISIWVDGKVDWDAVEALVEESYRSVATKRMLGMLRPLAAGAVLLAIGSLLVPVGAQHAGAFRGSLDDPAIAYATRPLDNVVADVNRRLQDGSLRFSFDSRNGYLNSALDALRLPVDSQLLVFSRGSLQGKLIDDQNPRALFFNERVALGWVRDGDFLEVAAHDATAGVVFYTLSNVRLKADAANVTNATDPPQFKRVFHCLPCHVTGDTLGVPGLLMFSTSRRTGTQFDGVPRHIDQSDPL
jgi:predicted DNA-binding protein (MmcQ/YjbR family)